LLPGKDFLTIQFTADSYLFDEKPKSSRGGPFYEILLKGTVNRIDAPIQQAIETFRYHEFVALVKLRDKRVKLVGTKEAGLVQQTVISINNGGGGIEIGTIEMAMESETLSPYYEV
ncbi:MAG TPA: hypothetical protein VEB42_12005, partial [Chitinophagaceae bacterium]|nr:hypothetical protein [Chitinophagaceae bacterium]